MQFMIKGEIRRKRFFFFYLTKLRLDKLKIRRLKQARFPRFLFHIRVSCLTGILLGSRKRLKLFIHSMTVAAFRIVIVFPFSGSS